MACRTLEPEHWIIPVGPRAHGACPDSDAHASSELDLVTGGTHYTRRENLQYKPPVPQRAPVLAVDWRVRSI